MRFKLFGTEFYISFLFSLIITVMIAFDKTGYAIPLLLSVLAHEGGHLAAMWISDCAPRRVRLVPAAVEITVPVGTPYKHDLAVTLCGPAVNILLFVTMWLNFMFYKNSLTLVYAAVNLAVALFNLLPVSGLDGGNVLYIIISRKHGAEKACLTLKILTLAVAAILVTTGVFLIVKGNFNPSFFITALYLTVMSIAKS